LLASKSDLHDLHFHHAVTDPCMKNKTAGAFRFPNVVNFIVSPFLSE